MGSRQPRKRPVVLLVEDEVPVRMFEADLLRDAGFEVLEAASADEALRKLETRGDIQVLFTDVHMPGSLDGLALARCVHERWPDVEMLIASGRSRLDPDEIPDDGLFVSKPYEPSHVIQQLRELAQRHH